MVEGSVSVIQSFYPLYGRTVMWVCLDHYLIYLGFFPLYFWCGDTATTFLRVIVKNNFKRMNAKLPPVYPL